SNFGVGVDAINLGDAKQRGIIVTNTPDVLNEAVADVAVALILNTVRRFPQSEQYLRGGNWAARGPYPLSTDIGGKVLGVLGLGHRRAGAASLPAGEAHRWRRARRLRRRAARAAGILYARQRRPIPARRQRDRGNAQGHGRPADREPPAALCRQAGENEGRLS